MSKITILWVAILSVLATALICIYNGHAFAVCYAHHVPFFGLDIPNLSPKLDCIAFVSIAIFFILFVGPLLFSLLVYGIYILIFDRKMPFFQTLLWFTWLTFLYYCVFQLSLVPVI